MSATEDTSPGEERVERRGVTPDIEPAPIPAGIAGPEVLATPKGRRHRRGRPRSTKSIAIEWLSVAVVAVLLALGVRAFVFQAFYVPSPSMVPALLVGDRILVQKLFFSPSSLHTGDIVVFRGPTADSVCGSHEPDLVKRVIGLPGETIQSMGNTVYIDGKPLDEPWLPKGQQLGKSIPLETIPAGQYFMMGDNRPVSCDSRYWGTIPGSSMIGKVVLLWWRNNHPAFHIF